MVAAAGGLGRTLLATETFETEPIELPHNQNVAVAHIGQGLIQPWPIGLGAGRR